MSSKPPFLLPYIVTQNKPKASSWSAADAGAAAATLSNIMSMDHLSILYTEHRPSVLLFHTDSEQGRARPVMYAHKKHFDFQKSNY